MIKLKFSDSVEVDTSGEARKLQLNNRLYVVGEGVLVSVENNADASVVIEAIRKIKASIVDNALACECGSTTHLYSTRLDRSICNLCYFRYLQEWENK